MFDDECQDINKVEYVINSLELINNSNLSVENAKENILCYIFGYIKMIKIINIKIDSN